MTATENKLTTYYYEGWVLVSRSGGRLPQWCKIGATVMHAGDGESCMAALIAQQGGAPTKIDTFGVSFKQYAKPSKNRPLV